MDRVIIHVDMDAFFASVEQMDNKKLRGKPVIVGGIGERGVVSTASYEARKYGVHSAMPVFIAKKRCPFGIYVPGRHERYKEVSNNIFKILYKVTPIIEPVSIDEAYLDITNIKEEPIKVAEHIKKKVKNEMGLTLSVGISYNKFLAKLASDWNKPDGIKIIRQDMIPSILMPLPINKIHGIGKKSVEKLNNIGIYTVEDMHKLSRDFCIEYFGKFGVEIYERIRGIDYREVKVSRERKSIGKEITLKKDITNKEEMKKYLLDFSNKVSANLYKRNSGGKTVTVKIKTSNFQTHTRSKTVNDYIRDKDEIYNIACDILEHINFKEPIRLIGLTVSNLGENKIKQLTFNIY
ncbi:DNA polymerase IV [Clostridium botulinum]|uniref:DNA polymerase IV n=1 Tax=Clostridium botulinum (strain Langeland / NCTC 10281 / Type F) TaxID=441772 RepID=A7GH35_CLOBL|nr:DNA polymerase IV [Clostridium botulinum]ABS40527.1 DNA polymerase IV [Clostridium botulinum F str. Langeland]ADG00478.1 DNA polymerase IV [Clostridium botulinum F str. 230613]KKM41023.1 DNA polymerase IV [Clostridium botulinum]MBD5644618.1 DNA polymerase IV [Clostridium botulinum]MBY6792574.1 DNA polymerase IV [Clostridium botulinum]